MTVNGVRLYYEERGTGAPILGIHGGGSSAVFWENAAERLAELGRESCTTAAGATGASAPSRTT